MTSLPPPDPVPADPPDPVDPAQAPGPAYSAEPPDPFAGVASLLLRPGVLVSRRDGGHLQVGLDPGLVLPDTGRTRELLAALAAGRPVRPGLRVGSAWRRVVEAGLLVDGDALRARLPPDPEAAAGVAAAYAVEGDDAPGLLDRRAGHLVAVEAPSPYADRLVDLLARSGVRATSSPSAVADVVLLLTLGVTDRARTDALMQADRPHLVVSLSDGQAEVGPFVVPGLTACLRCVDAARAYADPRRSLVVDQNARSGRWRADGVPAPVDPLAAALGAAWAVGDVVAQLDGRRPTTWSATVRLTPGSGTEPRSWPRHPHCGCAWLAAVRPGA